MDVGRCVYTGALTVRRRRDGRPAISEAAIRRIYGRPEDKDKLDKILAAGCGLTEDEAAAAKAPAK